MSTRWAVGRSNSWLPPPLLLVWPAERLHSTTVEFDLVPVESDKFRHSKPVSVAYEN